MDYGMCGCNGANAPGIDPIQASPPAPPADELARARWRRDERQRDAKRRHVVCVLLMVALLIASIQWTE